MNTVLLTDIGNIKESTEFEINFTYLDGNNEVKKKKKSYVIFKRFIKNKENDNIVGIVGVYKKHPGGDEHYFYFENIDLEMVNRVSDKVITGIEFLENTSSRKGGKRKTKRNKKIRKTRSRKTRRRY